MPRLSLSLTAVLLSTVMLAGCSQPADDDASKNGSSAPPTTSEAAPEFVAGGSADENKAYFNYVLRKAIRDGLEINGVNVVNTVAAAGFDKAMMQVTFDQSRTGLRADNIFVSVRVGEQCLIGQVVTADKTVTTSVQPAVGPDRDLCLIGETRPIDW